MLDEKSVRPLPLPDAGHNGHSVVDAVQSARGFLHIILLGPRAWKHWWIALVRTVGHHEIQARTEEDATFTFNYVFMVAIASGIATIGLLLNSPAVIIGAMLISPLMGPIVSTGFAITSFDVSLGKRGVRTLLLGTLTAVGFAAAIVILSPVKELTPEILARTRPNLLDLSVAILSGAAGGYATIRGRGGAIVGVAIATALMPPLAVVGYGLASLQWQVVRGALLLFVTNMVAIALAVAAIAEWYGFGRGGLRKRFAMQALISLLILAPLSVPLFFSLKSIAWESHVHTTVRRILEKNVQQLKNGQLAQVHIRFRDSDPPSVEAIVVSEESLPALGDQLRGEMQKVLGVPVTLHLTQLRADDPAKLAAGLELERTKVQLSDEEHELTASLHSEVPFPLTAVDVDTERRSVVVLPNSRADVGLGAWREMESVLAKRHADWHVTLVPPVVGLPTIDFAPGSDALDAVAENRLRVAAWSLERWNLRDIVLVGHADSKMRSSLALSKRRIDRVGQWFINHGVSVQSRTGSAISKRKAAEATIPSVEIVMSPTL